MALKSRDYVFKIYQTVSGASKISFPSIFGRKCFILDDVKLLELSKNSFE